MSEERLHAGKLKGADGDVWHSRTDAKGLIYWCGLWHPRTPEELYAECLTIIADLKRNHPELGDKESRE